MSLFTMKLGYPDYEEYYEEYMEELNKTEETENSENLEDKNSNEIESEKSKENLEKEYLDEYDYEDYEDYSEEKISENKTINEGKYRVTRGRSHPILYLSLRVVEQAEVLLEFLETSDDQRNFVNSIFFILI